LPGEVLVNEDTLAALVPNQYAPLSESDVANAVSIIANKHIQGFNYDECLEFLSDDVNILNMFNGTSNNYEKLHLYRILREGKEIHESDIITKFINESYHIENDHVMQLNPLKYDPVPQYIIDECLEVINAKTSIPSAVPLAA
jgi:hypothetical protein